MEIKALKKAARRSLGGHYSFPFTIAIARRVSGLITMPNNHARRLSNLLPEIDPRTPIENNA